MSDHFAEWERRQGITHDSAAWIMPITLTTIHLKPATGYIRESDTQLLYKVWPEMRYARDTGLILRYGPWSTMLYGDDDSTLTELTTRALEGARVACQACYDGVTQGRVMFRGAPIAPAARPLIDGQVCLMYQQRLSVLEAVLKQLQQPEMK